MLELKAAAWDDGYAIVEDGGALFLIRPPYRRENKYAITPSELAAGVARHGLSPAGGSFADWAAVIDLLKRKFLEARQEPPNAARIKKLVERAPADVVETYLDKVERDLFPAKQWRAAAVILTHLLRNSAVRVDNGLLDRVSTLMERAENGRSSDDLTRVGLTGTWRPLEEEFPLVKRLYGSKALALGEQIQREGQVLPMGSSSRAA